ncbi:MAG: N-acylglucosamine 2-epimerase [Lachnospiraceae bacterium]|nr:N-acylglucosamine 2-epimerase [Lachnospiraceae bacterium]
MFAIQVKEHLIKDIIPFWQRMRDVKYGGFYGYMGYDLTLDKEAVKGCILNSRILWFFSNAYLLLGEEELLKYAAHAFRFLREHCIDEENGGVYWSLTYDGNPEDTTKHTYNQAFAIYALSSYYDASKDEEALQIAKELYGIIETRCKDEYGYLEAFNIRFEPEENDKLSENGIMAEKTMNTLLHVFEAYTELYRVSHDDKVSDNIKYILDLAADKVYNAEIGRQEVFFDRTWHTLIDLYSYGHDIETAWLIDRGLEILGDAAYTEKISPITKTITANIYKRAYRNHSLINEAENGVEDTTRIWWVQAEAVVGFLNGYQKSPGHKEYLEAAEDIWNYIRDHQIDIRSREWFWAVSENGTPLEKPLADPWKCPYHNGRMCFEVIRRMGDAT